MSKDEKDRIFDAIDDLVEEETWKCNMYDSCVDCPDYLSDGHCKIRLAISALKNQIS